MAGRVIPCRRRTTPACWKPWCRNLRRNTGRITGFCAPGRAGGVEHVRPAEGARRHSGAHRQRTADAGDDRRGAAGEGAGATQARRVLLTAYADTEAAIRAINTARIHYYTDQAVDRRRTRLYPVLDDLLGRLEPGIQRRRVEGIRVVGPRYGLRDYRVRIFCRGTSAVRVVLDPERGRSGVELLKKFGVDDSKLPVVLFQDGTSLVQPGDEELAQRWACALRRRRTSTIWWWWARAMAGLAARGLWRFRGIEDPGPGA